MGDSLSWVRDLTQTGRPFIAMGNGNIRYEIHLAVFSAKYFVHHFEPRTASAPTFVCSFDTMSEALASAEEMEAKISKPNGEEEWK